MSIKRLYRNFAVHNILGHPAMQIAAMLGLRRLSDAIHDGTLPKDVDTAAATMRPSTHGADPIAGAAPLLPDLQAAPSPRSLDNSGGVFSPRETHR